MDATTTALIGTGAVLVAGLGAAAMNVWAQRAADSRRDRAQLVHWNRERRLSAYSDYLAALVALSRHAARLSSVDRTLASVKARGESAEKLASVEKVTALRRQLLLEFSEVFARAESYRQLVELLATAPVQSAFHNYDKAVATEVDAAFGRSTSQAMDVPAARELTFKAIRAELSVPREAASE